VADTLLTILVNTDYVVTAVAISANYFSHELTPLGYPTWFAVVAPTWDVTKIDNGGGGQPATQEFRARVDGSMVTYHIHVTGTKAGTNNYIAFAMGTMPAIANTTAYQAIGAAYIVSGSSSIPGSAAYLTDIYLIVADSIADNAAITQGSATFSYEI
jgi:hypothetical protein